MRKLAKLFLVAGGVLALALIAAALSANLYIESKDTQARIERKIARVLRVPVKITATRFSAFKGLQVTGIAIPQDMPETKGNFFEATSFTADFEYWPLVRRKLSIRRIDIAQPQLAWYQSAKGKWRAPALPESSDSPASSSEPKAPSAGSGKKPASPFEVSVQRLAIHDGVFRFYDQEKNDLFAFGGVNGEGRLVSAKEAYGRLESDTVTLRNAITFRQAHTDFSFVNDTFTLQPINASVAGGVFHGDFKMDTANSANPFVLNAEFNQVDLNRLLVEAGGVEGQASGLLSGEIHLQSKTHKTKDFTGTGKVSLARGRIQQYDLFQALGQALQIEELRQLNLQQAQVEFHCDDGKAYVDRLLLQSPNIKLTATGIVRLDGKMNLTAQLAINRTISRQLPAFVAENFRPTQDGNGDYQSIEFQVTGSVTKPRTNLLELALGKKIEKEVGGLLNSLFGGSKKKEPKKPEASIPPADPANAVPPGQSNQPESNP